MEGKKGCQFCKAQVLEWKIAVLTKIIEERMEIQIDFRNEVGKFIDDFLKDAPFTETSKNSRHLGLLVKE